VRSRKYGTLWRIVEKREIWQNTPADLQAEQPHLVPAIYLIFWKVREGTMPGIGIMRGYACTLSGNAFETNWEIV